MTKGFCKYGEIIHKHSIDKSSANYYNIISPKNSFENTPITTINVAEFNSKSVSMPSTYSAPTIKGLFTRVRTGFALISNIRFGVKTVQFMAVDGRLLSEDQCADPDYMSNSINNNTIKPYVFPSLSGLTRNEKTVIDAYCGSMWFTMFMYEVFKRVGVFDDSYVSLSITNVNMRNAFWNGYYCTYGAGFGTMDIVGHESGHGVIQSCGGLKYEGESGALNESIADILGTCLEKYYDIKTTKSLFDWHLGEDIINGGLRSFANPNLKGQPDTYSGKLWKNTLDVSARNNYGGVHTNSGVNNFFFYNTVTAAKGINDNNTSYAVNTAFPMFMLAKLIYLSLLGRNGYQKIIYSSTYLEYANVILTNSRKFLTEEKLSTMLSDSIREGLISVGVISRNNGAVTKKLGLGFGYVAETEEKSKNNAVIFACIGLLLTISIIFLFVYMDRKNKYIKMDLDRLNLELEKIFLSADGKSLVFNGGISSYTVHKAIRLLDSNPEIDTIELTTYGGSIFEGLRFIGYIRNRKTPIDVKVLGFAMSMGTAILGAATGKRIIHRDSTLMYHESVSSTADEESFKGSDFKNKAEELEFLNNMMKKAINRNNDETINTFLDNAFFGRKDVFITAEEALDLGLVDVVLD